MKLQNQSLNGQFPNVDLELRKYNHMSLRIESDESYRGLKYRWEMIFGNPGELTRKPMKFVAKLTDNPIEELIRAKSRFRLYRDKLCYQCYIERPIYQKIWQHPLSLFCIKHKEWLFKDIFQYVPPADLVDLMDGKDEHELDIMSLGITRTLGMFHNYNILLPFQIIYILKLMIAGIVDLTRKCPFCDFGPASISRHVKRNHQDIVEKCQYMVPIKELK